MLAQMQVHPHGPCTEYCESDSSAGYLLWKYELWLLRMEDSLLAVSTTNVTVVGSPSSFLDGNGALYSDGLGNGGGAINPKFKVNNLTTSVLESITILNAPLNSFSISYIENLPTRYFIIDNMVGYFGIGYNLDELGIHTTPTAWPSLVRGCGSRTTVSQLYEFFMKVIE